MISYLGRRVSLALVTVLAAVVISFTLVHLTPGSPGELILGAGATKAQIARENVNIGWTGSVFSQLATYLGHLVRGHLGKSIIDGHSIGADLAARLPVTGLIAVLATLLSGLVGTVLGVAAAVRGGRLDSVINLTSSVALSMPPFWIAVILIWAVAIKAGVLPATGYVSPGQNFHLWLESVALPVAALAVSASAIVARTARVAMRRALLQLHIHMLRSLATPPWRLLFVHALRNASVPIVSVLGVQFVALFSGSIIIENLFALPGLGQAASNAITSHDFPAVEGVVVIASVVVVSMNLVLDLFVAWLDPRVRSQ